MQREGWQIAQVRRHLGLSYGRVQRFFEADQCPHRVGKVHGSQVDRYDAYLRQRWAEGCHNALQLFRELQERGYRGSDVTIRRYVQPWREINPEVERIKPLISPPRVPVPSSRALAWLLLKPREKLPEQDQQLAAEVLKLSPEIAQGLQLVNVFRKLMRQRKANWIAQAEQSRLSALAGFASNLRKDEAAVRAAFSSPWSNGQTEGQVNRLKFM